MIRAALRSSGSPPFPLLMSRIQALISVVILIEATHTKPIGINIAMNNIANTCRRPWQCAKWWAWQCALLARRGPLPPVMPAMPMSL
jgi:hypothetical protein